MQQQIIRETFQLVSKRDENVCNFLEGGTYVTFIKSYVYSQTHCQLLNTYHSQQFSLIICLNI